MDALLEYASDDDHDGDNYCIICNTKTPKVRKATEAGLSRLREVIVERSLKGDVKNNAAILRLQNYFDSGSLGPMFYHHTPCYVNFASKAMIKRLDSNKNKSELSEVKVTRPTRSSTGTTCYDLCVLCQRDYKQEQLRTVQTFKINQRLSDIANHDYDLKRRLTRGIDAISSEVKYHTFCLIARERQKRAEVKSDEQGDILDLSFLKLVQELRQTAAKRGQVSSYN